MTKQTKTTSTNQQQHEQEARCPSLETERERNRCVRGNCKWQEVQEEARAKRDKDERKHGSMNVVLAACCLFVCLFIITRVCIFGSFWCVVAPLPVLVSGRLFGVCRLFVGCVNRWHGQTHTHNLWGTHTNRQTTHTNRHGDRRADGWTSGQTDRQTDTQAGSTKTDRQTDKQTDSHAACAEKH